MKSVLDEEMYIWASDPHGKGLPWIKLVEKAKSKYPSAKLIFGGDYIDGDKFVKETLDYVIMNVRENGAIAIKGNHEQLLQDFVQLDDDLWLLNGAKTTFKSIFGRTFSHEKERSLLKNSKYFDLNG